MDFEIINCFDNIAKGDLLWRVLFFHLIVFLLPRKVWDGVTQQVRGDLSAERQRNVGVIWTQPVSCDIISTVASKGFWILWYYTRRIGSCIGGTQRQNIFEIG